MRQHGLCHSHSTCIKLLHLGPVISARLGIKTSLLIKKVTNCVKNLEISFIGFFFVIVCIGTGIMISTEMRE